MKKSILMLIFSSLIALPTTAQLKAGTFTFGGTFAYSKKTDEDSQVMQNANREIETRQIDIKPTVGYFLSDKSELLLQYERTTIDEHFKSNYLGYKLTELSNSKIWGFGLQYRRYFNLNESFALFGQVGAFVGTGEKKITEERPEYGEPVLDERKIAYGRVGISPGLVFFPYKRIGIELTAGFFGFSGINEGYDSLGRNRGKDEFEKESIDIGLNLSKVDLGIRFYF